MALYYSQPWFIQTLGTMEILFWVTNFWITEYEAHDKKTPIRDLQNLFR